MIVLICTGQELWNDQREAKRIHSEVENQPDQIGDRQSEKIDIRGEITHAPVAQDHNRQTVGEDTEENDERGDPTSENVLHEKHMSFVGEAAGGVLLLSREIAHRGKLICR